ncbi:hypothetical protein STEG23_001967 [Scotinomys teguina]
MIVAASLPGKTDAAAQGVTPSAKDKNTAHPQFRSQGKYALKLGTAVTGFMGHTILVKLHFSISIKTFFPRPKVKTAARFLRRRNMEQQSVM